MIRLIMLWLLVIAVFNCGANPALDYIETTARNIQPIADKTQEVCNLSVKSLRVAEQDTAEIEDRCDELWRLLKILRDMQDVAIIAAGGEPCQNCSTSQSQ